MTGRPQNARPGFEPLNPATWTDEERLLYALGYGQADNGEPCLLDDDEHERLVRSLSAP